MLSGLAEEPKFDLPGHPETGGPVVGSHPVS